jgi:hypothetical protein
MSQQNKSSGLRNFLIGILGTVIGGIILAYIIQDARFDPNRRTPPTRTEPPAAVSASSPAASIAPTAKPSPAPPTTVPPAAPPSSTPTPEPPTETPVPPTPTAKIGYVIYEADWSQGMNGWAGVGGWKALKGKLINDGSNLDGGVWTIAPYQPGKYDIADYAVEAEFQVVNHSNPQFDGFGIVTRGGEHIGYRVGIDGNTGYLGGPMIAARIIRDGDEVKKATFDPGSDWNKFRVEVNGNEIKFWFFRTSRECLYI